MKSKQTPSHASWESTLRCPLRCKHCGLDAGQAKPDELTTEEAIKMLHLISRFGIENLIISGGEFTFRSDWLKILEQALPLFTSVRIITCGWLGQGLFTRLRMVNHLENLTISVSLDGLEAEHDFRRGRGSFQSVIETLTAKTSIPRTVLMTVDKRNIDDILKVIEICLRLEIPLISLQISLPAGRMNPDLFLGQEKILNLAKKITKWRATFAGKINIVPDDCFANLFPIRDIGPWSGCYAGKELLTILSDGSITGCPTMSETFGNIKQQDISKIWSSIGMERMRAEIPSGCMVCGRCPGGCKAVAKLLKKQFCLTI
jgi:radical SAM protein with 4Fe4S-binding SPASM domain